MNIPVKFLNFNPNSPSWGYWDMFLLDKIFHGPRFRIVEDPKDIEPEMIVIIPARHNYDYIKEINNYINALNGVLLIIAGDEESKFPVEEIKHPNMKLWLMTPHAGRDYPNVDRFIGEFTTPQTESLPTERPQKDLTWFFAGQVNHARRAGCVFELRKMDGGKLLETPSFAAGMTPEEYISIMARSKIVPCPGGPATPDTFRFYEALEAACIPIVDEWASGNWNDGYWKLLFGESYPFPTIKDWKELPALVDYYNDVFLSKSNEIFAWWQLYKRQLMWNLLDDFDSVALIPKQGTQVTAVIPTSPTESNPDTSIIEETIRSIRVHHPEIEIFITFDGVRDEQKDKREAYEEYKANLLWKCNREWKNVYPIIFDTHKHQVGMMRETLRHIRTDQILYVEHDAPLTPDMPIDWDSCMTMVDRGDADLIRFHFEAHVPESHNYLMLDDKPQRLYGDYFVRTIQWSQRPHLASKDFYKRILEDHFSPEAVTFIEDKMHGVVIQAYKTEQLQGWNKFRLWIYHPVGQIKRSYHLDGRGSEDKYPMTF